MFAKKINKGIVAALFLVPALLLGGVEGTQAMSVDVTGLSYADSNSGRSITYDFSSGTATANVISIPPESVTPGTGETGTAYFWGNASAAMPTIPPMTVTLSGGKATVSPALASGEGVAALYATGTVPVVGVTTWSYSLNLSNFVVDLSRPAAYSYRVGLGGPGDSNNEASVEVIWVNGSYDGTPYPNPTLILRARVRNGDNPLWSSALVVPDLSGHTPASTSVALQLAVTGGNHFTAAANVNGQDYHLDNNVGDGVNSGYTLTSGSFLCFPDLFPYLSLQPPEDPFQVRSQHWKNISGTGSYYNAWLTVDDPGQATYSAITVNSSGYLDESSLAFNPSTNYWELPTSLFSDNFNNGTVIDGTKWTTQGNAVTQGSGTLRVAQNATDGGGAAVSREILVNPYAPIVVQRRAYVHAAASDYEGLLALCFGAAGVTDLTATMSVVASHIKNVSGSPSIPAEGFYLGLQPAHASSQTAPTAAIWDTWIVEKIFYNPISGEAQLYIDNELKATYAVGALPAGANYLRIYLNAMSMGTGHYIDSDDLTVTQPWFGQPVFLSNDTPPALTPPVTFNFTATKKAGGTVAVSKDITGYVEAFAPILAPTGNVTSATPTFSWTAVPGATAYAVQMSDANGNRIWNKYDIPPSTTSWVYNVGGDTMGPALVSGNTYKFDIVTSIFTSGTNNDSFAQGSFTYDATASPTISFSGWVKTAPNWPSLTGIAPAAGAVVKAYLAGPTPTLISTATVEATTGAFTVTDIPASSLFYLVVEPPPTGGYLPALSRLMSATADIQAFLPYVLFTTTQYANTLSNPAGTGIILGRVALSSNPTTFLAGATIVATQWVNGSPTSTTYPVTYNSVTNSTGTDGIYMVKNIPAGTLVQLTATLANHTFDLNGAVVPAAVEPVSEESFFATLPGPTVSFSGVVQTYDGESLYGGALVRQTGNTVASTATDSNGAFTLGGLPSGVEFSVKITADGYVPTYTRTIQSTGGVVADRNYNLFTQTNLNNWGVAANTGLIRGRVLSAANPAAGYVSGATVIYDSAFYRTDYVVKYEDQFGNLSTTGGTTANGKYYIFGVADGDTVTVTATHSLYTFPALTDAGARKFVVHANAVSEGILKGSSPLGRVPISGYIKDGTGTNPIKGATVEQVGESDPINATVSNADGLFYLTVSQGVPFYLKISKPQAGTPPGSSAPAPTYTAEMSFLGGNLAVGEYNLFPPTKLTNSVVNDGWGVTNGKGIIRGRVKDNLGANLAGAVVSYTSAGNNTTYDVCYDDACNITNANGGFTQADGRYIVRNVVEGDTVTVTAAKAGYAFNSRIFHTYGNALHQGGPVGTTQDESTIRSRFDAMLAEYNKGPAGNFDTVMSYFSTSFLDDGDSLSVRRADMLAGMTAGETRTYTGVTVTVSGDGLSAVMVITWNGGDIETMYLAKEGGIWLIVGNQARHSVGVQSQHWGDGYHAGFYVVDTPGTQTLTAVTVTGPEITGSLSLTYEPNSGNWYNMTGTPFLGETPPAGPQTYTITVTEGSTDYPYTRTISGYVTAFASLSSPFNTFGSPVVFSWRGIPGATGYRVELNNDQNQRIWEKGRIPRNQWGVTYDGAPLESGKTYTYYIVSEIASGDDRNMSYAQGSFTYSGAAQPVVSYGNYVTDIDENPIEGAQVEQWNAPLDSVTFAAADGSFTLGNILARTPVQLKFSTASGHVPTYSAYMGFSSNVFDAFGSYKLFTQTEYDAMGVETGKGVIRGFVRDASRNALAGATVTAWSALGNVYEVRYYDDMTTTYRNTGGTYPSGRFAIMNVVEGDRVVASAQLNGFSFSNPKVYATYGGTVSQGGINASNSCSYAFNSASVLIASGGNGAGSSFGITTNAACTWTAVSNNTDWLHITGATSGVGAGSVNYTVDANSGAARTGTITVGGQAFTVNQLGVGESTPYLGVWGAMTLNRDNGGSWYTETTRLTFNAGGAGTAAGTYNNGANAAESRIADFTTPFTYLAVLNGDGSYSLTLTLDNDPTHPKAMRLVFSDNGNVALVDGTTSADFVKFSTLVRLDGNNNHGTADVNGPYYHVGYERNVDGVADPTSGNGTYMSISGSHQFSGAGTYTYTAEANSIYQDGHAGFWLDDQASVPRSYNIAPDGLFTTTSGAARGFFSADGRVGMGAGSYASNNWTGYLFLKQADRSYGRDDLTGTWAVASLGDKLEGTGQSFSADFGTMTCEATGPCTVSVKTRVNGGVDYNIFPIDLALDNQSLGGFGPGPRASGAQVGAIGNDGKTLILNLGIADPTKTTKRQIAMGVKATATTNLSGGKTYDITTGTLHLGSSYYAFLNVPDAGHTINAVQVKYNGNTYNASYESGDGAWLLGNNVVLGASPPTDARLEIAIQDGVAGPWYRYERTVSGGITGSVSNVLPTGTVSGPFAFSFTGIPGGERYFVHLFDATHTTMLWHSDRTASLTTIPYTGDPLTPGATYTYEAIAQIGSDLSMVAGQFTYSPVASISFTGYVTDSQSPAQIVAGATVEQGGVPTNIATTDGTGQYTLANLPAGTPFYLKIYKNGSSYAPAISGNMSYATDKVDTLDRAYTLFPTSRLGSGTGNWNVESGKGIIRSYVRDKIDGYVGGALVTATGLLQANYPVCYDDACTAGLTWTQNSGRFVVKNVLDGDTVTVTATKDGWTANSRVYHTFADSVSQGRITLQGPVSLAVNTAEKSTGSLIQGAQLQVVGFPTVSALTGTDGTATLTGLPSNVPIPVSLSKSGYVSSYRQFSAVSGAVSWRVPMFAQADLTAWGIQSGKGVIYGRVMDNANPDDDTNSLAGVQVHYQSAQGKFYDVVYLNSEWTIASGATETLASGRYLILNVSPDDMVTVSSRKAGWSFWSETVRCYADGVTYGYMKGTAGGAQVTVYVKNKNGAAIPGATVRVAETPALAATSDGSGKATLTNLPLDTPLTFEVFLSGYHNAYSRHVTLTGNSSNWGNYFLFLLSDNDSLGGIPADKGVIMGWVKNDKDDGNLSGAHVNYTSARGNAYQVVYLNDNYTIDPAATATKSNGRFAILNVEPGDTVVATAELAGWVFEPRAFTARANAHNQASVYGKPAPYRAEVWSGRHHQQPPSLDNYWVGLQVRDDAETIDSVTVTGPGGLVGGGVNPQMVFNLVWNASGKTWSYWNEATGTSNGPLFNTTMPDVPLHYTFDIREKVNPSTPIILTATVESFVDVFGATVSPAGGTVSGNPTFSWSGTIPQEYTYMVELSRVGGGFYWNSGEILPTATSFVYNGPVLAAGSYTWNLLVRDMFGNFSMVISPAFTVEAAVLKGDLDGNQVVNLADAVIAMKALSGLDVSSVIRNDYVASHTDVNGDDKAGLAELLYILQVVGGLR